MESALFFRVVIFKKDAVKIGVSIQEITFGKKSIIFIKNNKSHFYAWFR
jgi:hypothetical protein